MFVAFAPRDLKSSVGEEEGAGIPAHFIEAFEFRRDFGNGRRYNGRV